MDRKDSKRSMTLRPFVRPFGVALDASDDPWSIDLKLASIYARQQGLSVCTDPYEALIGQLTMENEFVKPGGKLPLPSWLGPIPDPSDILLVRQEWAQKFLSEDGPLGVADQVKDFVLNQIIPDVPLMLGVDHSSTGGVVAALSEIFDGNKLTILVLDHHFDALPLSSRLGSLNSRVAGRGDVLGSPTRGMTDGDRYCCGNFWAYLMEKGVVKPEHFLLVGAADYPVHRQSAEWDRFRNSYLAFETKGCSFFPLSEFEGRSYKKRLKQFLYDKIETPYLYVSLDLDVGSYRSVHAARYMDGPGIEEEALIEIGHVVAECCASETGPRLVGLDVMEFNMHLLGAEFEPGINDGTAATALGFIGTLLGSLRIAGKAER